MKIKLLFQNFKIYLILVLLFAIPAILPLFHKGIFPLHDSIFVARIYENYRALKDLQFPVRWAPDMRYGEPLFNFYAPLPYYVGSVVHLFHFTYIDTSKILLGLSLTFSGIAMFFLASELFGKAGGLISAVLYMYAPYHSVDLYVRGALSEAWALIFFPLIFLFILRLSRIRSKTNFIFLVLSLTGLFITHNIMSVLFAPFILGWVVFLNIQKKEKRFLVWVLLSLVLSVGISSSFLLPAFFEKDLVESGKLVSGYYDFRAHFVEISQFFSTFWGYGPSVWGPNDGLSFQVGLIHWILIGLSMVCTAVSRSFRKLYLGVLIALVLEFLFSLFMQHNKSTPIWLAFPILAFTQFPWRFLGITIFTSSLLIGSLGYFIKGRTIFLLVLAAPLTIFYYNQFFHPQFYYENRTDQDYIADIYLKNEGFTPRDYVPIFVKTTDNNRLEKPRAREGAIMVSNFITHSSWARVQIESTTSAKVEIPITYFPGWTIRENGQVIPEDAPSDLGLIQVSIPKGNHNLSLNFDNTPVRTIGNALSALSIISILLIMLDIFKIKPNE